MQYQDSFGPCGVSLNQGEEQIFSKFWNKLLTENWFTGRKTRARIFPKKSCVTFDVLHTNINVLSLKFMYKYLK